MLESSEMPAPAGCGGIDHPNVGAAISVAPIKSMSPAAPYPKIVDREAGEGVADHPRYVHQDHQAVVGLATTIDEIREEWRQRQAWHRAEKALTLQAKALCRRLVEGDKAEAERLFKAALGRGEHPLSTMALACILPLVQGRDGIEAHRKDAEKRLIALAMDLPVAPFVEGTRGVGMLSLAAIVGEAGDLSGFATPARLWKRMGLAVMADGRQRRVGGADALEHGYSPARRSVMWNVGACIVKAGGPLKAAYDARKAIELPRCEGIASDPIQRSRHARGGRYAPRAHAHNRAQRYVEKRFLRSLWRAWRKGVSGGSDRSVFSS